MSPLAFGALPDDEVDDGPALQEALDSLPPGGTLLLPPGRYLHADVLVMRVPGTTLAGPGSTLTATVEDRSAFVVDASDATVRDVTFTVGATTGRGNQLEQHKVLLMPRAGITLSAVSIDGSAASGVFVYGSDSFLLDDVRIRGTRADGIHMTFGAHDGRIVDAVVSGTGDDGIAVVSYRGESAVHDVAVERATVSDNTHGRGISVVGGHAISWSDIEVRRSASAAVYVAVEGEPLATADSAGISVERVRIIGANTVPAVDQGAVLVYSGPARGSVTGVHMNDVDIMDTRAGSSRQVGVFSDGGTVSEVFLDGFTISGGPDRRFASNVTASAYKLIGW
ncbi:glycosyl hydrolase family 28-related protein [Pseudonocardia abyssalis]|nr:glycosyl hydrolase family 28-related protein [Pseudonocardia abyssalis]